MRRFICVVLVGLAVVVLFAPPRNQAATNGVAVPPAGGVAVVDHPVVGLNEVDGEAEVPAQEAGVLKQIRVREGQEVRTGDLLANIDDNQARLQKKNAAAEHNAAQEKAESNIDIEHATAAAKVAEYEYLADQEANRRTAKAFTEVELQQKKFAWDRAKLAIEQARRQKVVDTFTAVAKEAESELADESIERRKVKAPIDGVVQRISSHQGEWVKPGDPVLRIVHMDRLSVSGTVKKDVYNPSDVIERPVVVEVQLAGGRVVQFPGKIAFVDVEVQGSDSYSVRAEVENRKENNQWLLRPHMSAKMTIQLR